MNRVRVAALINSEANPFQQRVSYIHSTPILERRRRSHWDSAESYSRGSWKGYREPWKSDDFDDDRDPFASRSSSWFRQDFNGNRFKKGNSRKKRWNTRFDSFVDDDDFDVENLFKSAFGGTKHTRYFFIEEEPKWRGSSGHANNHWYYWKWGQWGHQDGEEDNSSSESDSLETDLTSDRLALGLSSSGPLSVTDVKNAYRKCALKWHPDRHHGRDKAVAEEKFKLCSAAYQSICDKLGLN